jgi:molecular chaperone DnaK (HSP70)
MAIPVGWAPAGRRALRRAAEQAGIRLAGFVSESTAAFAKYRDRFGSVDEVAVFDWGAGTLDISVLRIAGGQHGVSSIEEKHCARSDAAGDTIDTVIAQRLHRQMQQSDQSLPDWEQVDPDERTRLCHQAEFAKIALSSHRVESMPIVLAAPSVTASPGREMAPNVPRSAARREVTSVAEEPRPVFAISPSSSRLGGSIDGSARKEAADCGQPRARSSAACE